MEKWKERHKLSHQGWMYAIQRLDLLIIAISGAGIYLSLETLKYIDANNKYLNTNFIKYSGVCFVLSIVINFISQYTGMLSNKYDMLWCELKTENSQSLADDQLNKMAKYDRLSELYDCITNRLNITSMIMMFAGIASITYFFMISF